MQLTNLHIKNFRSLEKIELQDLRQFNVLIGKNNAGKSAVFSALRFFADIANGNGTHQWGNNILSHFSKKDALEMSLEFNLTKAERDWVIESLFEGSEDEEGMDKLRNGPFIRKIMFHAASWSEDPPSLFPRLIEVFGERADWVAYQEFNAKEENEGNYSLLTTNLRRLHSLLKAHESAKDETKREIEETITDLTLKDSVDLPKTWGKEEARSVKLWPFILLSRFLKHAFFFDHFRKFYPEQTVGGEGILAQDGNNLVQVLHFWSNNHRPKFERIQKFVQSAFAGVGGLETPITGKSQMTQTAFRSEATGEQIPLQHMGGGVAQLLMAAVALETTTPEFPIFLEEPETNLHPGAQRFLAERLCEEGRQVFITTHSPTFVNLPRPKSVHKVKMSSGRTQIVSLNDETLHLALSEIGARNSDVLLSDAVIFVEGESDLQVIQEWCRIKNIPLAGTNTSLLLMRSIGRPETALPLRSDTLKSIATSAGIPHLFLLDGDEMSESSKRRIKRDLADSVHIFERRELENYLLVPPCIRLAISEKLTASQISTAEIEAATDKQIEKILRITADSLKHRVLVKRVRSMLEPPSGGFFPRQLFEELEEKAGRKEMPGRLEKALEKRFEENLKKLRLENVVKEVKKKFDKEWKNENNRLHLAPGEELLNAIFKHFGTDYNKTTDARRIAKHMSEAEFDAEMLNLLGRINTLTQRETESA